MGYGQGDWGEGDYGQGDYGQGDPGLFSFIGKAIHAVGGLIPGVGGVISAVEKIGGSLFHHAAVATAGAGGGTLAFTASPPVLRSGSSETDIGYGLFHRSTSSSLTRGGGGGSPGAPGYHQIRKGRNAGKWTRNRHMNVTNPRALRRAIRRGHGFEKMARRMLGFATPHKPKGRVYFKRRTSKR
jgi:hypothetical protein